jgi:aerobic-type carbon monoxide dehydrogenase small subunit (CoxS/CutS family)
MTAVSSDKPDTTARRPVGPSASVDVTVVVNGKQHERVVPVRMTLAQLLRDEIGLTGTKVSCDMQACGACSVLVNGEPISSCTYLAADADGRAVETVEGLADVAAPSDLQTAFMDNFALQCGFCTPGFLMMATALLHENPRPSRDEVIEYLEGNICRCTGYEPIVNAILSVANSRESHGRS